MEQSRTFVIILIVSIAAAVIIAVGLLLFSPRNSEDVADAEPDSFDPYSYLREPEDNETTTEQSPENQVDGQPEEQSAEQANIIAGLLPAGASETSPLSAPLIIRQPQIFGQEEQTAQSSGITITPAPRREEDQVQAAIQTSRATESTPTSAPRSTTTNPTSPEITTAHQSRTRSTASPRTEASRELAEETANQPQATSVASLSPTPQSSTEYWIQLFSSTNHQTIVDIGRELSTYNIQTKVSSRTLGETTHFRLRFGPFEVMNEAQKFLTWIRQLENYSSAYISQEIRH